MKITPDKILFFDLDGTLIDTDYANWLAYNKAYDISEFKKDIDPADDILFEFDVNERVDKLRITDVLIHFGKKYCDDIIIKKKEFYSENLKFTKQIEENVDILKRFSKTNKIILVSNCSRERGIETLKYHQLDTYFHKMFFAEDKTLSENKYENAIQLLGISPDNIVAFEDDKNQIEIAKEVGIKNINVSADTYIEDIVNGLLQNIEGSNILFYQNNDAKIRIEIDREILDSLLKDIGKIFIDERIYYFPKKEGESRQPQGVKYRIWRDELKEFTIESNGFLDSAKDIHSFYHKDYIGGGNWKIEGKIEYLIWALKNDEGCKSYHKRYLSTAYKRLKFILRKELPKIKEKIGVDDLAVCVVPRAKEGFVYKEDQLLFRKAVSDVVDELKEDLNLTNGTKYLVRHTSTKTTHLRNGEGLSPYPGITQDTCYISDNVIGKDILLVDDVYTKSININEDAIQALLDKGANSVYFYSIGKTHSLIK